ncbi:MAG: helix-turn-helix transcriptional regulator [bacterium]|nr:helix-turn-helix transcriptional regulator [Lachnospiraceae bacterium]
MQVRYNERLRRLRKEHHLTQQKVASVLGVSQRAYSDYETGQRRLSIEGIIKLARYYDVSLNFLAGISNIKSPYPEL